MTRLAPGDPDWCPSTWPAEVSSGGYMLPPRPLVMQGPTDDPDRKLWPGEGTIQIAPTRMGVTLLVVCVADRYGTLGRSAVAGILSPAEVSQLARFLTDAKAEHERLVAEYGPVASDSQKR